MRRPSLLVLVIVALTIASACDGGDSAGNGPSSRPTSAPTTKAPARTSAVRVYFVRDEKIATAGRSVEAPAVARGALTALLEGPDAFERGIGMQSQIPGGARLRNVDIGAGTATVDVDERFESGGGSLSMSLRVAQVVFTLTQFPTVQRVSFLVDGVPVQAIGGEGIPAQDLTRADFELVTPLVLVEAPVPGATVTSPVTVSGTSNTFEATVSYSITDPDGLVLDEGFTTATAGSGTRGSFELTAEFTTPRQGLGAVTAFQVDPQSGERRDVYEVPVRLG